MDHIFWLRKNRSGLARTITSRITIASTRKNFSTGIEVLPENWDSTERVLPNDPLSREKNDMLLLIEGDLLRAYNYLTRYKEPVTVESIYNKYAELHLGFISSPPVNKKIPSIRDILNLGLARKQAQVGVNFSKSSYERYDDYANNFLTYLYDVNLDPDKTLITDLTTDRANDFIKRLVTHYKMGKAYANKHVAILRIISNAAFYEADGWALKMQTRDINKFKEDDPEIIFLTLKEIKEIEQFPFLGHLDRARDMLLALCEIGQHVTDYHNLVKNGKIEIEEDGSKWISSKRIKTSVSFDIMITPRLERLILKYGAWKNLPTISRQKANDYFQTIADRVQIDKKITTKIGRKTFCNIMFNEKRLDEGTVSDIVGIKRSDILKKHYAKPDRKRMKDAWN